MITPPIKDHSVTIAKAIAIILMVMGHSGCPNEINSYLGLIRMPLFFFMSGYCFKETYLNTPKEYVKKRIRGVYWPYIKWGIFFLFITNVLVSLQILSVDEQISVKQYPQYLANILFSMKGVSSLLGGYWFLNSLFWGSLLFYITKHIKINLLLQGVLLFAIAMTLNFYQSEIHVWNLNWLNFFAAFFIWSGNYYKTKRWNFHRNYKFILITGICIGILNLFWHSRMTDCQSFEMPTYAICAISGTLMIFGISYYIKDYHSKIISFLIYTGGYTFNILTWHFLSMKLITLSIIIIYNLPFSTLQDFPTIKEYSFPYFWIIYTLTGVLLPILGTYIFHNKTAIKNKIQFIYYSTRNRTLVK